MDKKIKEYMVEDYEKYLHEEEKSKATIEKYLRDIRRFMAFASDNPVDKNTVIAYKNNLEREYAVASVNSILAALNGFFIYHNWHDCKVKQLKTQRRIFRPEDKELSRREYERLVEASKSQKSRRLNVIMQTIANTGIRISELSYITIAAAKRGYAEVNCKGKIRIVFIPKELGKMLTQYANETGIENGRIFITKTGKPINRSNVWREMKELCKRAGVDSKKVFPHNFRHLFAYTFYSVEKDLGKLADILGHTSIETTRIYTMTTGKEHQRKMSSLRLLIT